MRKKLDEKLETGAVEQEAEQANEALCKPGAFVKGDPRINRTDGPGGKKRRPPRVLRDMLSVYEQEESKDRGPAQQQLRKMFKEDTDKFIARMRRLEEAYEAQDSKRAPREEPPIDLANMEPEKAETLCREMLDRLNAELAAEDAELAKRPDAAAIGASLQKSLAEALRREAVLRDEVKELRNKGKDGCHGAN